MKTGYSTVLFKTFCLFLPPFSLISFGHVSRSLNGRANQLTTSSFDHNKDFEWSKDFLNWISP